MTGLSGGTTGRLITVQNVGTAAGVNLTLKHESASSTTINRFVLPGNADLALPPGAGVELWYDSVTDRWRARDSGARVLAAAAPSQVTVFSEAHLGAGVDYTAKTIFAAPSGGAIISRLAIVPLAASAGIDNANTAVLAFTRGSDAGAVLTKTYNTATQPPTANTSPSTSLGTLSATNKVLGANETLRLAVTQGVTADLPAFQIIIEWVPIAATSATAAYNDAAMRFSGEWTSGVSIGGHTAHEATGSNSAFHIQQRGLYISAFIYMFAGRNLVATVDGVETTIVSPGTGWTTVVLYSGAMDLEHDISIRSAEQDKLWYVAEDAAVTTVYGSNPASTVHSHFGVVYPITDSTFLANVRAEGNWPHGKGASPSAAGAGGIPNFPTRPRRSYYYTADRGYTDQWRSRSPNCNITVNVLAERVRVWTLLDGASKFGVRINGVKQANVTVPALVCTDTSAFQYGWADLVTGLDPGTQTQVEVSGLATSSNQLRVQGFTFAGGTGLVPTSFANRDQMAFYGDSITEGNNGTSVDPTLAFPWLTSLALARACNNRGVAGTTCHRTPGGGNSVDAYAGETDVEVGLAYIRVDDVRRLSPNAPVVVTAASNAAPVQITAVAHGLITGERVVVAGVVGNYDANGDWVVTKVDADNVTLNTSVGSGAYTSGGIITKATPLKDIVVLYGTNDIANGVAVATFQTSYQAMLSELLNGNSCDGSTRVWCLSIIKRTSTSDATMALYNAAIQAAIAAIADARLRYRDVNAGVLALKGHVIEISALPDGVHPTNLGQSDLADYLAVQCA